jgi:integrase
MVVSPGISSMALTDLKIRAAQPEPKPYHLTDGHGLFLAVQPNGSKLWRWKYRFQGKYRLMAFGCYPSIRLADARAAHTAARAQLLSGTDPMAERKAEKSAGLESKRRAQAEENDEVVNPFCNVAAQWFAKWKVGKVERYAQNTEVRLREDVLSRIGNRPIQAIKPQEIAGMIIAIEERGAADVARRALQNTQQIFRYAMAFGLAEQNPAAAFRPSDILRQRVTANFARVDASELPTLLKKIDIYDGSHFVRLALQMMALVFVRTGELIPAQWSEFDRKEKLWSIPAQRMKMRRPHLVPLSRQLLAVLDQLWERRKNDVWVFPGERNCPFMNKNSMLGALKRMGYKGEMTGHGFRGLASTILNEMGYERAHIEMQLAHAPKNQVEAAYNKALYLPQRRIMMQGWADFLNELRYSSKAGRSGSPRINVKQLIATHSRVLQPTA